MLTCVALFVSFAAAPAVVVTASVVVVSSAVYDWVFDAVSSVSTAVVVTMLGGHVDKVAILTFGAVVLSAIITALTAITFALKLVVFLCHFFLLPCLPCPGPSMLSVETEGDKGKLVDWCWVLGSV